MQIPSDSEVHCCFYLIFTYWPEDWSENKPSIMHRLISLPFCVKNGRMLLPLTPSPKHITAVCRKVCRHKQQMTVFTIFGWNIRIFSQIWTNSTWKNTEAVHQLLDFVQSPLSKLSYSRPKLRLREVPSIVLCVCL